MEHLQCGVKLVHRSRWWWWGKLAFEDYLHSLIPVTFCILVFSHMTSPWHHRLGGSHPHTSPAMWTQISEPMSQNKLFFSNVFWPQ